MSNHKELILKTKIVVVAVVLLWAMAACAQESPAMAAANDLFARSDWAKAVQAYSQITVQEPANGLAWQNLGESNLQLKKYDPAVQAFRHAAQLMFRPLVNMVNVARALAAQGDRAAAFAQLHEVAATGKGSGVRAYIRMSPEFAVLAGQPEYRQIMEDIAPCRTAEFRQFDFWVGDWEVRDPSGANVVGANLVTREQEGCLIMEHWTSAAGGQTGTSFNYYDIRDKKWHQLYLDNSGNAGAFPAMAGEFKDNKMVLLSDEKATPVFRWTWYVISPGRVRQMAERSDDGQKTWRVTWDSVYVEKTRAEK